MNRILERKEWINNCDAMDFIESSRNNKDIVSINVIYGDDEMTCFMIKEIVFIPDLKVRRRPKER